eukprot:1819766-Amphidinium_carterae.1
MSEYLAVHVILRFFVWVVGSMSDEHHGIAATTSHAVAGRSCGGRQLFEMARAAHVDVVLEICPTKE